MSARVCLPLMFILAAMCAPPAFALEPAELILIVNKNEPASGELAAYYARVRGVPAENIIPLDLPKDESISRRDYEAKLLRPLREAIGSRRDKIRCLVCMYGVPLRVGDQDDDLRHATWAWLQEGAGEAALGFVRCKARHRAATITRSSC